MRLSRLTVGTLAVLLALGATVLAKSFAAERFDSRVRVLPGNLLEVTETVVFRFDDGTFDHVFREIPQRRTDGIDFVGATMDGQPFPAGHGPGKVAVSQGSRLRVEWHFPRVSTSAHTFGLTYRVRGAVRRGDAGDELVWQPLPSDHDYTIAASTVDVEFAGVRPGAVPDPQVSWRRVNGRQGVSRDTGAEAGAAPEAPAFRTRAADIEKNGWFSLAFTAPAGTLIAAPPDWQQAQIAARDLAPRWLMGAGLVLGAGLVALFGVRQRYDRPPREQPRSPGAATAPEPLPPAVAGALVTNGSVSQVHALATLFGLADRGAVRIEQEAGSRWRGHGFVASRIAEPASLASYERALLALLFPDPDTREVALMKAWRSVVRHFRRFSIPLREDLVTRGLIDPERQRVKTQTTVLGVVMLLLGGLAAVGAALLVERFGPWPFLVPAAFAVGGIICLITAGATTPLSNEGVRRAARWREYRSALKMAASERGPLFRENAVRLLPTVVALGVGTAWVKQLRSFPGLAPEWLSAFPGSNGGALTELIALGNSGHHGAGAGGAAGAAGGGSSGAG